MENKLPVSIYTEATPNPEALKFVANKLFVDNGNSAHFETAADATLSPLATQLFVFPFVKEVFIMNNFVTITRQGDQDWYEIMHEIRQFLKEFLESEQTVIESEYFSQNASEESEESETVSKIKNVLETYVKPAVEMDGGAIEFVNFDNGKVELLLKGACSGCPSSTVTLKQGIEGMMKRMVPEVQEVVAVAG